MKIRNHGLGDVSSIQQQIVSTAQQYDIPPSIALAVAQIESGFNQSAISPKGAIGVMQLMPGTAGDLGVDPTDLNQNIQGGIAYLQQLYAKFGDWNTALAAYYGGPGNIQGGTGYAQTVLNAQPSYLGFDTGVSGGGGSSSEAGDLTAGDSGVLSDFSTGDNTALLLVAALGVVAVIYVMS